MTSIKPGKRMKLEAAGQNFVMNADEVSRVAYDLYQQRGCQSGHELDDWLQAEDIVRRRCAAKGRQ